jgi:hypothetical protein
VGAWLRIGDGIDTDLLAQVTDATNAWVTALPHWSETVEPWPPDLTQGAIMLAARLYRRRNTPAGVESMPDGAVYLPKRDADIDPLLKIGRYAPPRVG